MILRKLNLHDIPKVLVVAKSTGVFTAPELTCLVEDMSDSFTDLDNPFYVYEEQSHVVGFVQFGPLPITNQSFCLYWLGVSKDVQGNGIGRLLVDKVELECKKLNARIIFIETSSKPGYANTRAFYQRCNYEAVCTVPGYYAFDDDKVIFSKRLD